MKKFIKFVSIMAFGIFCFIGGVARGDGKNYVAAYCVVAGFWLLLNGYAAVLEMETNELLNNMSSERTVHGKKSKSL